MGTGEGQIGPSPFEHGLLLNGMRHPLLRSLSPRYPFVEELQLFSVCEHP